MKDRSRAMPSSHPTRRSDADRDRVLLERIKTGDQSAVDELIACYRKGIYANAYRVLRNHHDAEEATQDAFVKALRGLATFRGECSFSTWLYQISFNGARNRYRHWICRGRNVTDSLDAPLEANPDITLGETVPAESDSTYDGVLTDDLLDRIEDGMKRLSARHREILILRNIRQISYEEIAAMLAVSMGTVKSRIARAREELRALSFIDSSA